MQRWFNVQHSPMGAYASLTFGHAGTRAGVSMERGCPGDENVFLGWQSGGEVPRVLPFFADPRDDRAAYEADANMAAPRAELIDLDEVQRDLSPACDRWIVGPLTIEIVSPRVPIPDPEVASEADLRLACCPAVFVRIVADNSNGAEPLHAVFALQDKQAFRPLEGPDAHGLTGVALGQAVAMGAMTRPSVHAFTEFSLNDGLARAGERCFRLGKVGGLRLTVAPHEQNEVTLAVAFYRPGVVSSGVPTTYFYRRYFASVEAVLAYALDRRQIYYEAAYREELALRASLLSPERQFIYAHSVHSYYGNTAWLDRGGTPLWVVAEGEYEMLNTLDLAVDQTFYELARHPWTVRNVLEFFAERYAYWDDVTRPGSRELLKGGISFCHDQGVAMQFTPPRVSSYEQPNIPGRCFSYMSYEQLTNYVLVFGMYVARTNDDGFLHRHRAVILDCAQSLLRRDDPEPGRRTGLMGCDGARVGSGQEITTYDALDGSLGPARGNLYLATKSWASHIAIETLALRMGDTTVAEAAAEMAVKAAGSIIAAWSDELGYIPASLDGRHRGAIVPAVEGLVYPWFMGRADVLRDDGPYRILMDTMKRHLAAVLKPGVCLFEDGGWKLSSTSDNAWLSKIAIAQFVAEAILDVRTWDAASSDAAHVTWLERAGWWACSDQFVRGEARGSRFYPRGVSSAVWLRG